MVMNNEHRVEFLAADASLRNNVLNNLHVCYRLLLQNQWLIFTNNTSKIFNLLKFYDLDVPML